MAEGSKTPFNPGWISASLALVTMLYFLYNAGWELNLKLLPWALVMLLSVWNILRDRRVRQDREALSDMTKAVEKKGDEQLKTSADERASSRKALEAAQKEVKDATDAKNLKSKEKDQALAKCAQKLDEIEHGASHIWGWRDSAPVLTCRL